MHPLIIVSDRVFNKSNNVNDPSFTEEAAEIFHVIVKEKKLKLLCTVEWRDPETNPREYEVVSCTHLYLDGLDDITEYGRYNRGKLSSDPTITHELFNEFLDPYGIKLNKVAFHSFKFFESVDFDFTDETLKNELFDRVNTACKKIRPRLFEY